MARVIAGVEKKELANININCLFVPPQFAPVILTARQFRATTKGSGNNGKTWDRIHSSMGVVGC